MRRGKLMVKLATEHDKGNISDDTSTDIISDSVKNSDNGSVSYILDGFMEKSPEVLVAQPIRIEMQESSHSKVTRFLADSEQQWGNTNSTLHKERNVVPSIVGSLEAERHLLSISKSVYNSSEEEILTEKVFHENKYYSSASSGSDYQPSVFTSSSESSHSSIYSNADTCVKDSNNLYETSKPTSSTENNNSIETARNENLLNQSCGLDNKQYTKSASARERPTICPICYDDVITHFTRHLFRHHSDNEQVKIIKNLKPRSKERLALVSVLRKQGYFHLKTEKDILHPVKTSKNPNAEYFVCQFCLGHYKKELLYKHVKVCKNKPETITKPGRNCLTHSQTFMALIQSKNQIFLKSSRIKTEVFGIMRPDEISFVAKTDPLICLYGEALLSKHKRQQIATVISNKIREMARLTMVLKSAHPEVKGLFSFLSPNMFEEFIMATKSISGYDEETKTFKSPSLALHMGTNLKMLCDIGYKIVLENKKIPNIAWEDRNEKKSEIKDLKKIIVAHWCIEISSLALKNLKENQWEKPMTLPSTNDIQLFQNYLHTVAEASFTELKNNVNIQENYKKLTECVLVLTVMFNRKRIGDVQYLKVETYNKNWNVTNQETFLELLTPLEKVMFKKFKRIVVGGKGSKPVPILLPKRLQIYISTLLETRKNLSLVPSTNPYLFANVGSMNRWMSGVSVIRKLAHKCGAKDPQLLTSTKFRKHIATTLQLMNMDDDEIEQVATFMGHTKKTHEQFYRLPVDAYQTAKVAKVLLLLEKGKGSDFKGKNLEEIQLDIDSDIYCSSDSDDDVVLSEKYLNKTSSETNLSNIELLNERNKILENEEKFRREESATENEGNLRRKEYVTEVDIRQPAKKMKVSERNKALENEEKLRRDECATENEGKLRREEFATEVDIRQPAKKMKVSDPKSSNGRVRWSVQEKNIVSKYFSKHIKDKITPKKHECDQFLSDNKNIFINKDWVRIKTFVYNSFRAK